MKRIRIGNDFAVLWSIKRSGIREDLSTARNMKITAKAKQGYSAVIPFEVVDTGLILLDVAKEWAIVEGIYNLEFEYELKNHSYADKDEKITVDKNAFVIVPKTAQADDVTSIEIESDILIGLRGKPFYYEDFTPAQITGLMKPAQDAAVIANAAADSALDARRQALDATQLANEKAALAGSKAMLANEKAALADSKALKADNAAEAALTAKAKTETATRDADTATQGAITATQDAIDAKDDTVIATINANNATRRADASAENADVKAGLADTAAAKAINATADANDARDYANTQGDYALAQGNYAKAQANYAKEQGEAVDGRISEVEGKIGYSLGWYGIEFDETIANSACTRIGEMDLHRRLPIQNQMRRCLLLDNGKVNYYLHKDDSTKKADGTDAVLDGTDGQVMVEIPAHWRRFEKDGTVHRVKISDFKLEGFHFVPKAYRSAYEATVHRPTNKLTSVVNMSADYRGGDNSATNDGASASLLGKPATAILGTNFALYAKNRGDRWCMDVYHVKKAMDWLYYIEFANFNSQLPFNPVLTAEGFKQGGLSNGVTDLISAKWGQFNGSNPFIPMGYTNSLGNKTGVKPYDMPPEYDAEIFTTNVPSYRGIENPFGHIWKWTDGLKINIQADNAGGESQLYVTEDITKFQYNNYEGYEMRGLLPRANGYISKMIMGDFGDLMPSEAVGGSTTFFADYWYASIPASGESQMGVRFGGTAGHGAAAGLACADSLIPFSTANALIGSRLCFLP